MAREAGANKVYFASAAPAIKYQNLYGIDMPATSELIASNKSNDEVAKEINADWLIYQNLEDLHDACIMRTNQERIRFEDSVFSSSYVTGDINSNYLEELEVARSDEAKAKEKKDEEAEEYRDRAQ